MLKAVYRESNPSFLIVNHLLERLFLTLALEKTTVNYSFLLSLTTTDKPESKKFLGFILVNHITVFVNCKIVQVGKY